MQQEHNWATNASRTAIQVKWFIDNSFYLGRKKQIWTNTTNYFE